MPIPPRLFLTDPYAKSQQSRHYDLIEPQKRNNEDNLTEKSQFSRLDLKLINS